MGFLQKWHHWISVFFYQHLIDGGLKKCRRRKTIGSRRLIQLDTGDLMKKKELFNKEDLSRRKTLQEERRFGKKLFLRKKLFLKKREGGEIRSFSKVENLQRRQIPWNKWTFDILSFEYGRNSIFWISGASRKSLIKSHLQNRKIAIEK